MVGITQWHTLVAALWAALGCGFAYTFPTFSLALGAEYHLDAGDLSTVGIATTAVGFMTWTAGLLTDLLGPRLAILVGGLLNAVGWLIYGIVATLDMPVFAPVFVFTALGVVLTFGASFVTASVFSTLVKSFPADEGRATAVGVGKAWAGAASGFSAMVFTGFLPSADDAPERLYYILFLSAMATVFVLVPLPFPFWQAPSRSRAAGACSAGDALCLPPRRRFPFLLCVTAGLIAATLAAAALGDGAPPGARAALGALLLALAALPWLLLLPGRGRPPPRPLAETLRSAEGAPAGRPPASPWECGPGGMLRRPDAWLLWLGVFALQAGGLLLTTNLGLITASRGGVRVTAASANAIFSASQSLGRLSGGPLSDALVRCRVARPAYFIALSACMAAGHGLLCLSGPVSLSVGVFLSGYAFGSQYPVLVITVAELFGPSRVASNYMVYDGTPGAFAALLVAKGLATWVYQSAAGGADKDCFGDACFAPAYVGTILIQAAAAVCVAALAYRAVPVYRCSCWAPEAPEVRERAPSDCCRGPESKS